MIHPRLRCAVVWVFVCFGVAAHAQNLALQTTTLRVQANEGAPDLQCQVKRPPARPQRPAEADTPDVPDEEDVKSQLQAFLASPEGRSSRSSQTADRGIWPSLRGQPLRVGIWGDSHLAAAFFTQELQRLSKLPSEQMRSRFVPASMNRPGVRLPLRKSCLGPNWEYEPAHAGAMGAAQPGPGLVNVSTRHDGAWLSLDVRNAAGQSDKKSVRFLYQQTAQPILLAIRVDDAAEQRVELQGTAGPAKLDLVSDEPLSTVYVRVIQGPWRLHGLEWAVPSEVRLQMDVFGYPGATVAGWRQVDAQDLLAWREPSAYDVVVLAFGTNEGNVQPFDGVAYTHMLQAAVASWRQAFPGTACLLIAPGDRGVLVPRASKPAGQGADRSPPSRAPDFLRFTRVHAEIGRVQKQVARAHGCHFWSMFDAMGGAGGAYRWARQTPPLMARDLIHFTVPGYQRLAQLMAQDLGWNAELFQSGPPPARR
jgi:lysophospholipase L1-like esterase